MKKPKENWTKVTLLVAGFFVSLIILFGIEIFLWMQSWKVYQLPNNEGSIKYPSNFNTNYSPESNKIGELTISNESLKLTIDTSEPVSTCKNTLETCVDPMTYQWTAMLGAAPVKNPTIFHGISAYFYENQATDGFKKVIIFYNNNTVYTIMSTDNSSNIIQNNLNNIILKLILNSVSLNN